MKVFRHTSQDEASLPGSYRSVPIPRDLGMLKRLFAFSGPAYLISVGYMDPGNWATDIEGGARFGYTLIWVLLMSNLIAVLLQTLSARLGIVSGRDLAQACRDHYPKPIRYALWILCECAIGACDLAEVLGTAIGLNLLFHLPLLIGVLVTGLDTLLFLLVQNYGIRKLEAFILVFVSTIGVCFLLELVFARPEWGNVAAGFVPKLSVKSLFVAVGIIGATVMPHNLYLHSALVQTRAVDQSNKGKRDACRYNLIDTGLALNAAFVVNAAILIVAAAVFFRRGIVVTQIQQAHEMLTPLLGTAMAGTLFAVALIAAGQSSTLTGTLAGQIVMEGFIKFKMRPVLRRLTTRLMAIIPAVIVISWKGDAGSYDLLLVSQVILSLQLPFAVVPLIRFTSDRGIMGEFANRRWVTALSWIAAATIIGLNAWLVSDTIGGWIENAGENAVIVWTTAVPAAAAVALLLIYVSLPKALLARYVRPVAPALPRVALSSPRYERIGVAIDFGVTDPKVLSHAQTLASHYNAELFLFHIVEGVIGQVFGKDAFDDEARRDSEHLEAIAQQLRDSGSRVQTSLGFGRVPVALVELAVENRVNMLIMGGHGHRGVQDLLFGTSISEVRHQLAIPVLVVQ